MVSSCITWQPSQRPWSRVGRATPPPGLTRTPRLTARWGGRVVCQAGVAFAPGRLRVVVALDLVQEIPALLVLVHPGQRTQPPQPAFGVTRGQTAACGFLDVLPRPLGMRLGGQGACQGVRLPPILVDNMPIRLALYIGISTMAPLAAPGL